ncbi:MAG: hypothetical protein ACD_44C00360G0002 [uncultured bacterium]|nr:MAG: hypothetical protein ACD_44C00360G0002 [uncultured bacterium]OGT24433.1 MAG: hypothetical protein A2W47_05055 [Gammaproteobacteria bacterium RIFCSPHIGHO2_12_38_15]OGT68419.1 MAG: hypothetical protein A3I12_07665 [Gammaproteobacteria bacterium RIFCSPLOWO2_02_FULL_38_11]OGT77444.1 MAG: hypothetical protein A3G71_01215 [Gammaproteobacteria bacterium RIFCSPLOWO2_12_FULL_38_14]
MSDSFFSLAKKIQRDILSGAGIKLKTRSFILEKDIWICWVLKKLFSLPATMSFKGGTSLSKVYGLIRRFSEDCDITFDYRNFISEEALLAGLSKTALKKLSQSLKMVVKQYSYNVVLPYFQDRIKEEFKNENFKITLSDDGEQLRIYYPSLFNETESYLKDHVFIEFGGRNSAKPSETHIVKTTLSQVVDDIDLPIAKVQVLSPLRTFWEKATLMHVACHRGNLSDSPDRFFRHWYDLAMLTQSWVGETAIHERKLLEDVVYHKSLFFNSSYACYDDCLNKNIKLIPSEEEIKKLEDDFSKMKESAMFYETPLSFHEIIDVLKKLEEKINT